MKYGISGLIVYLNCFWDGGSTCSVILTGVAEKYGLYGTTVTITLITVSGSTRHVTKLYALEFVDRNGKIHILRALGLPSIGGPLPTIVLEDGLKFEFSQEVQATWQLLATHPKGMLQVLIGADVASWHPRYSESSGHLVVYRSPLLGDEYVQSPF